MAFVQIIEFRTSDIEPTRQIYEQWRQATEGKRTVRRELLARDHSDPSRYFAVAFFDSYESAMENSDLPETRAAAEQHMKTSEGPPVFYNLDILEDRAWARRPRCPWLSPPGTCRQRAAGWCRD